MRCYWLACFFIIFMSVVTVVGAEEVQCPADYICIPKAALGLFTPEQVEQAKAEARARGIRWRVGVLKRKEDRK